ncbi:hypothetical protein HK098_005292, partial [Nowakowskiella sp. JEL0407]
IPKEVIKGIYNAHHQRLVQAEDSDDEDHEIDVGLLALATLEESDEKEKELRRESTTRGPRKQTWFGLLKKIIVTQDRHGVSKAAIIIFVLGTIFFFLGAGLVYENNLQCQSIAVGKFFAGRRRIVIRKATFALREKILGSGMIPEFKGAVEPVDETISSLLQQLTTIEYAVFYGNESFGIPNKFALINSQNPEATKVSLEDVCQMETNTGLLKNYLNTITINQTECNEFANGLMTRGLHESVFYLADKIAQIQSYIDDTPQNEIRNDSERILRTWNNVIKADLMFLVRPLGLAADYYTRGIQDWYTWYITAHLVCTVIFITVLALLFLFLIRPMAKSIADESHRTTMMLFMIPPELLSKVQSILVWAGNDGVETGAKEISVEKEAVIGGEHTEKVRFASSIKNLMGGSRRTSKATAKSIVASRELLNTIESSSK